MEKHPSTASNVLRQHAEIRFADELARLTKADENNPKPQGWLRSPVRCGSLF